MSDFESQIRDLRERTELNRRDFIRAELQTCSIAVDRGHFELSLGNRDEAEKECAVAHRGAQVIDKFLHEGSRQMLELEAGLLELKASIESLSAEIDAYLR
jgi:hypothetical protein